ncbi:MAG: N-acetylglucosamine kinase [Pyrinomonadaceae bacterium]
MPKGVEHSTSGRREPVNLTATPAALQRQLSPELYLGVDGGGTKTHAVIVDRQNRIVGEGTSGPSNPLRVGVSPAAAAVREAVDRACAAAGVRRGDVLALGVGLAGVRRADLSERMREALHALQLDPAEIVTDADIALFGATNGAPGLVVIAGTGSICCGRNARGRVAYAGGWGPIVGDEGGGSWIARRGLRAVAHAADGRGPETALSLAACEYFNVSTPGDLATAIYAPNMTNERLAGFGRHVVEAAQQHDAEARDILKAAGVELGLAAGAVVRQLRMEREKFQVAYVGGIFHAGEFILGSLREAVTRVAAGASFGPPQLVPAVAAAYMARAHRQRRVALAG